MQADLPHTLYDFKKDGSDKKTKASDEVIKRQLEANKQMEAMMAERRAAKSEEPKGEKSYDIDELFKE